MRNNQECVMKLNIKEFLEESGIKEPFYPGKRLVRQCVQMGEFKSHSVVLDWRENERVRIDIRAGVNGRTLPNDQLKKYPVSFQSPTYVVIEVSNDDIEDEDETDGKKGKSGGGGKGNKKKKKSLSDMVSAFSEVIEGKIPEAGKIVEMVVMGKEIAAEAYQSVLMTLTRQIEAAKVCTTELIAKTGSLVTKFTPPAFMEAKGDETATYKYDREKNVDIGFKAPAIG